MKPILLLVCAFFIGVGALSAQSVPNVAGNYSATESARLTITEDGITDVTTVAGSSPLVQVSQNGSAFSFTTKDPSSGVSLLRTFMLSGNSVVSGTGPIVGFDPAYMVSVTKNEITSVTGLVSLNRIDLTVIGRSTGVFDGVPFVIDVVSTVVLTGTVTPIGTAPVITVQPQSKSVTAGGSVTFSVTATGEAPLAYQWRKDGVDIPGATAASYTRSNIASGDAGNYSVFISNGKGSVTSGNAALAVNVFPVITTQPASQTVAAGASVSFTVVATGTPTPIYQWRKSGVNIAGATGSTLTLSNVASADAVGYSVVVSNAAGSVTSATATLTVNSAPVIATQPAGQTVAVGASVSFTVVATGTAPLNYQWRLNGVNVVSGGNAATLSVVGVTTANTGSYTVVVSNGYGSVTSAAAVLALIEPLTFTTLAGRSLIGSVDGTGGAVRFANPSAVAVDGAGNLYVADSDNHTIRKIAPAGVVSTLAGMAGVSGSADGAGAAARFYFPRGVAVDGAGNVYVGDTGNHTIRKITAGGVVSTLAGMAGLPGAVNGAGAAARFGGVSGLAVDGAGNVFVADTNNNSIRKITPAGVVTTVAGLLAASNSAGSADGVGTAARFNQPRDVAVDAAGNLYVADSNNSTIRKITPGGVVTTLAGLAGAYDDVDGAGSVARFDYPTGVAVDGAGNVFVANSAGNTIRKITAGGAVTTLAGSYGEAGAVDGAGGAARFDYPFDVAVDGAGNVFAVDQGNGAIRKIAPGEVVTTVAGSVASRGSADGVGEAARFRGPAGLAADDAGNVYVADRSNHAIRKISPTGSVITLAGLAGVAGSADGAGSAARFELPQGVFADGAGNVFVADTGNCTIRKITSSGIVTTVAGMAGVSGSANGAGGSGGVARFNFPQGLAMDGAGALYVADTGNHTIRKITPSGVVSTLAGTASLMGSVDGAGAAARFNHPGDVAIDAAGNLYVADSDNATIRKITPAGVVSTLAGVAGMSGAADGAGSVARFAFPTGVAVDGAGSVYVADFGGDILRRVSPAGAVTTVAGTVWMAGSADGTGGAVGFSEPYRVAVDPAGIVYVTDSGNNTIRRGVPAAKASGGAYEFAANITHPSGNVYDQVLLTGAAATITADAGQITRMSYIDLSDDIVQVEFSGPGSLTLRLENATGPALPVNYNQAVSYMKGHGTISISGAGANTHVSVFTVGTVTAVNPALFKAGVSYDGVADIALLSIGSADGRFGGVRLANAEFSSNRGMVGISAAGVGFAGPINVHNVSAGDQAEPVLVTGAIDTGQIGITGGDMRQLNGRAVKIEGATTIRMLAGATSHNVPQPAQTNQARYERSGQDVTAQVVQGP